ncbi:LutC/YkgG family protein [Microlunatus ginsengisoli]|uniref:LUD domain-containing protein n=1 Tax=Microlunatus ginsengisoli TaxID=363863 RepID=A0ABP6ZT84_9ACTN
MNARQQILNRIREAHELAPPSAPAYEQVDRAYRDQPTRSLDDVVELLVDRLVDYRALVRRCAPDELASTIAAAIAERGACTLVVPFGLPTEWSDGLDVELRVDRPDAPLTVADLDAVDGVVTGCAVAAAETGTLVLDASPDQGRRAITLVPDYHLCVVERGVIVPDVPEMIARMDPTRPLTMISGPSATSDIELNRVEGVHGPRTLEVIVVG